VNASGGILVSGATGLVGTRLCAALLARGDAVRALTRDPAAGRLDARIAPLAWDGTHPPVAGLAGCAAVVHLAGEPVFAGRLTQRRRQRIRSSRVDATRELVRVIGELPEAERPRTLVCASAVGYYGDRGDERLDEQAAAGSGFLADVCREWESAAAQAERSGVRVARLRIGIVLARQGGALPRMALPFRMGMGGRLGSGRQWFPWIHIDDVVALIAAILDDEALSGPINASAPEPARNAELARTLVPARWRTASASRTPSSRRLWRASSTERRLPGAACAPRSGLRGGP